MKYFYICICILVSLFTAQQAHAAFLYFDVSEPVFGTNAEVTLPLMLNTEGEAVNALEVAFRVPSELSFVDAMTGSSVVPTWVELPHTENNVVTFSGIIPGGFDGVIDPFKGEAKLPGLVAYITFKTSAREGISNLVGERGTRAYSNDGSGTELPLAFTPFTFTIKKGAVFASPIAKDETPPLPFEVELAQDPNIFDGNYFIAFVAQDKESGISYYEVKEGANDFVKATSPYELTRQTLGVPIVVKAVDKAGNIRLATIEPGASLPSGKATSYILYIALGVLVLFIIFRKKLITHAS